MPIIQARGSLSSQGYGQFARQAAGGAFIEDVFSTTLYTGTGAAQSIPNGIRLANGATSAGWIALLGGTGSDTGRSIAVDSSGNVYVCGSSNASGTTAFQISKYSGSGAIQWQRSLNGSGIDDSYGIAVDSSANVYVCGRSNAAGTTDIQIAKYNTSGAIQWQRRLGSSGADEAQSIAVDSSGNIYVGGHSNASGTTDFQISKYDTSGTIQWQRRLGSGNTTECYGIAVDSSANVYVCGRSNAAGTTDIQIAKYNTSGAIQWQRRLVGGATDIGFSIAVDSSGNAYVCGYTDNSGFEEFLIAKYNTSGTIQWQRRLGGGGGSSYGRSIAVDSSGNVYVCGLTNASGSDDFQIAKYNTSGAIQWQRRLRGSGSAFGYSIAVDSSSNVYVCGHSTASGSDDFLLAKLPGDGSGTGPYNVGGSTFTYAASTLTDAATSFSDNTSSLTDAATSLTDAASTLTDAATTLTSYTTPFAEGAGLGGLVWIKGRSTTSDHALYDTARGATFDLVSNSLAAQTTQAQGVTAFLGSGFSIGTLAKLNTSAAIYAAWTFAEQQKFFDVVTYTGDGVAGRTVAHNLGSVPGCIIVKRTNAGSTEWAVYHRSLAASQGLSLSETLGAFAASSYWNSTAPSSSTFTLGSSTAVNATGDTYVAYLFAHDAGGFGASGTDNVISCGSFTGDGSGNATVTLGWEPQFVLIKKSSAVGDWHIYDNMRGLPVGASQPILRPNLTNPDSSVTQVSPTATGFTQTGYLASGQTAVYIAIRRGPMRTPTSGSSVFTPTVYTGTGLDNRLVNTSIAPDMVWIRQRNDTVLGGMVVGDRLRGQPYFLTGTDAAEVTSATAFDQQLVVSSQYGTAFSAMNGVWVGTDATAKLNVNNTANNHIVEAFRRAPGFFDVVCYTGTGVARTVSHNLGVVPELIIVKSRADKVDAQVYASTIGASNYLVLSGTAASASNVNRWNNTAPTASVFTVGTNIGVNGSGYTYVAYLFSSVNGVSKVGTYTGTGSTVQVDCGFTAGARFVLIKRTNATGDWYVWDSARGIVAGNDPYLVLNSTAAEVTSTDWVDTLATGFEVSNAGSNLVNVNGGVYTFLAIA